MLASDVIDKARELIKDPSDVRWADSLLLGWVGAGQRAIASLYPKSSVTVAAVQLTSGESRQSIPSTAFRLVDILRNMGTGSTPGQPIRRVNGNMLRAVADTWNTDTAATVVKNYSYGEDNPTEFFIWPRPTTNVYVEMATVTKIDDPATTGTTLFYTTEYEAPLVDYVVFRSLSQDDDLADPQKAASHLEMFTQAINAIKEMNT